MQLSECVLEPGTELTEQFTGALLRKQELIAAGDPAHEDIKTALAIGSGAMRGVFSGGVVTGLEQLGLSEVFDDAIGISVGASSVAYFLARQAAMGTTLFPEELTSKEFINRSVGNIVRGQALNVGYLETIFTGPKALDQAAIRSNRSRFHIGVTKMDTAHPDYIEIDDLIDDETMIKFIQASSAVPGVAQPLRINGRLYGDGVTTCRNPIRYAIEVLGANTVLYVNNCELRTGESRVGQMTDRALSRWLTRGQSPAIRKAYRDRHVSSDESAQTRYEDDVLIGVLCPDEEIPKKEKVGRFTQDSARLWRAADRATQQTVELFA